MHTHPNFIKARKKKEGKGTRVNKHEGPFPSALNREHYHIFSYNTQGQRGPSLRERCQQQGNECGKTN